MTEGTESTSPMDSISATVMPSTTNMANTKDTEPVTSISSGISSDSYTDESDDETNERRDDSSGKTGHKIFL